MDARTGFVTQIGMDRTEAFDAAAEYGFEFVELMMDGANERRRLADRADEIRAALGERGLDLLVHLPFGGVDIGSPLEHVREGSLREVTAAVETAADVGAEKAVLHPDTNAWSPAWETDELHDRVIDSLRELDARAADRGVSLCAENVPRSAVRTHEFPKLLAETDISMTLDTGHARIDGRDSGGIAAFVSDHGDRIDHVHLNDTRRAQDEHLPFGSGTLDFERIFDAFPDGWTGTLSLEVFTDDYDYIGVSKDRLDALR